VKSLRHVTPFDPDYPPRLRALAKPPQMLSIAGGTLDAARAVAVVGSRECHDEAAKFARKLAAKLVLAGVAVVSGGALGIDEAAHEGALDAGGRTWAVAGTGCEACFPPKHAELFARIAEGPGCMVWPFAPAVGVHTGCFTSRNRVLVALADAVVVVQAGPKSGALNAAATARRMRRPLWVAPAPPWLEGFQGSHVLLHSGARPLTTIERLLASLDPDARDAPTTRSPAESAVLRATPQTPLHLDAIAHRAHLPAQAASAALLTLALENVVVEGPAGFYRRRDPP
jgi:DNA processing protein